MIKETVVTLNCKKCDQHYGNLDVPETIQAPKNLYRIFFIWI